MPPTYPDTVTKRAHDRNIFPAAQVHFHTQKLTFLSAQRQTNYDVHHHHTELKTQNYTTMEDTAVYVQIVSAIVAFN